MNKNQRQLFEKDPEKYLENEIKVFTATSPSNSLPAFGNSPIYDEPIVGFANGDDHLFKRYKTIIDDFHLTPREALELHINKNSGVGENPSEISVISWILPKTYETRLSLRKETQLGSMRENHTRWLGEIFVADLSKHIVLLLKEMCYQAVAPELADFYEGKNLAVGRVRNWSQKHIAYAAGLGTFGLNGGFISEKGVAVHCGSIVCDIKLQPNKNVNENPFGHCLFHQDGSCGLCIERCPAGAISENGLDRNRCAKSLMQEQKTVLEKLAEKEDYMGKYPGCGLCHTAVPCEHKIPQIITT
ncbi:4Fe-4S double cluster binding domain-containing protein [Thermodesulfobacteriota bacterium]